MRNSKTVTTVEKDNQVLEITNTIDIRTLSVEPLRTCRKCGCKAYTEEELEVFSKNGQMKHGRGTICKKCDSKKASKRHFETYEKSGGKGGFDSNKKAYLYFVKIEDAVGTYFKVGITNRTVKERFAGENDVTIKIVFQKKFDGNIAKALERSIIEANAESLTDRKSNILKYTGNTEIFDNNIFN